MVIGTSEKRLKIEVKKVSDSYLFIDKCSVEFMLGIIQIIKSIYSTQKGKRNLLVNKKAKITYFLYLHFQLLYLFSDIPLHC